MIILKKSNVNFFIIVTNVMLVHFHATYAAIVDTKTPIVIYDNGDVGNDGMGNDNYFGYSLAFTKGNLNEARPGPATTQQSDGTLFIGAPNEKRVTKNSGVVWQCNFNGENAQLSCSIMSQISEQSHYSEAMSCPKRFHFPENETEQWIGASLSTSSTQLFACAPRWKRNGWRDPIFRDSLKTCEESAMVGACYKVPFGANVEKVLTPLNQPKKFYYQATFSQEVNEYWFLYAELGFSSHVTFSNSLLIGAPSVRKWRGAVVEYPDVEHGGYGAFIHNEKGDINGVEPHSLLGYTVTSGRLYKTYYIASGAPRAGNLNGMVTISNPHSSRPIAIYRGEQFGSYFGYALATADLNADGYDELLVGAPWQIDPMSPSVYSSGCVMVIDVKNNLPFRSKLCMNSVANSKPSMGSRFGSAVCSLGDINFDQRDDFAISAPYDDDGTGTIFIYHGSYPPPTKPTQVIRGKSMDIPNLRGLGTHLISGSHVDVDGNGTPDLIISSFESRHVIVLRTRPVATASLKISFHTTESIGLKGEIFKLLPNQKSFRVHICIAFRFSVPQTYDTSMLATWLQFEVDSREKRVVFENSAHQTEHSSQLYSDKETCVDTKLLLSGDASHENSVNPIEFQAILKYNETELLDNQPVQHATLNVDSVRAKAQRNGEFVQDSSYQAVYKNFKSYLPAPIPLTFSRKERLEIAKDNCESDGNPDCDTELHINLKIFYGETEGKKPEQWSDGTNLVIGKLDFIAVSIAVSNKKETAYRPTVRITFDLSNNFEMNPKSLTFKWAETPGGQCTNSSGLSPRNSGGKGDSDLIHTMQCPQPLQTGRTMNYLLEIGNLKHLKVRGEQSKGELTLKVDAFPESREEYKKKSEKLKLPLKGNVVIDVESPSTWQSEIDPKKTTVVDLTQLYIIKNTGVSATSIDEVRAEVLIPTHINFKDEKNATQVIGVADPSNLNVRCEAKNFMFFFIQELGRDQKARTNASESGRSRSTRSVSALPLKGVHPEKLSVSGSSDKYIVLSDCNSEGMQSCQKIVCYMDMPSMGFQEISIKMYFLKEGVGKLVTEETKGIRVQSAMSVIYMGKTIRKTGSTQRGFILLKSVPAWVYLASGAGGTILFLLIAFALFKCGFFRRKTKEQLKVLKRQTMQIDANALHALDASIREEEIPTTSDL